MIKVNYIYHSCFAVETDSALLVYDYWKDSHDGRLQNAIETNSEKQLYFIVSHFHQDHFNPEIAGFAQARRLVSYDTSKRRRIKPPIATAVLRPGDVYEDENLKLNALRSTDVGIATLVTLPDGTTIYHAGDNNNWYFVTDEDEHIRCSLDEMEGMFISNLREVRSITKSVDHVMFPVDPRLGSETMRGSCQWLQQIKTGHFYPMHCWGRWDEIRSGIAQLEELFPETAFVCPDASEIDEEPLFPDEPKTESGSDADSAQPNTVSE